MIKQPRFSGIRCAKMVCESASRFPGNRDEPDDGDFSCREGKQTSWKCRFSLSLLCVRLCLFKKKPLLFRLYLSKSINTMQHQLKQQCSGGLCTGVTNTMYTSLKKVLLDCVMYISIK